MQLPITFNVTFSIQQALNDIGELVAEAERLPPLPQSWEEPLRHSVVVTSVRASTAIEGNPLTTEQVSRVLRGQRVAARERDIREVKNYERAVHWVFQYKEPAITEKAVLRLHYLVTEGIVESGPPGQYRTEQNSVINRVTGERIFLPPSPDDVPALMRELVTRLQRDRDAHFAMKAALVHLWLVAVHPFNDGNGRVARLLSNSLLLRAAPRLGRITALEAYFFDDRERYWQAIARSLGPRFNPTADITPWVEYFLDALQARMRSELLQWGKAVSLARALVLLLQDDRDLPPRVVIALVLAISTGGLSAGEYRDATGISARSASNDLAKLVRKGWLVAVGERRGRRYRASQKLSDLYQQQPRS